MNPAHHPGNEKNHLRDAMRAALRQLSPAERQDQSRAIVAHLRQSILPSTTANPPQTLVGFVPLPTEPNILPLLTEAVSTITVCLVRMDPDGLVLCPYQGDNTLLGSAPGQTIRQPDALVPTLSLAALPGPVAILVPGLAFDRQGNRLGRGQAWYDRFLAQIRRERNDTQTIGVCFRDQLVAAVPHENHDQTVDFIVGPDAL